jgi:hypothetical protein
MLPQGRLVVVVRWSFLEELLLKLKEKPLAT